MQFYEDPTIWLFLCDLVQVRRMRTRSGRAARSLPGNGYAGLILWKLWAIGETDNSDSRNSDSENDDELAYLADILLYHSIHVHAVPSWSSQRIRFADLSVPICK